jgi:rRNA maturation endonuclease Nob1
VFLNFDDEESRKMIKVLLHLGIRIKYNGSSYDSSDKTLKYGSDVEADDRGVINCLARETKNFCDCMKKKKEAKEMAKLLRCYGCSELFPKEQIRICTGCKIDGYFSARFHSKECHKKHWPEHRIVCKYVAEIGQEKPPAKK